MSSCVVLTRRDVRMRVILVIVVMAIYGGFVCWHVGYYSRVRACSLDIAPDGQTIQQAGDQTSDDLLHVCRNPH